MTLHFHGYEDDINIGKYNQVFVEEVVKTTNISSIEFNSLLTRVMLNDNKFEIRIQTAWV
jgi:hypothetical protein